MSNENANANKDAKAESPAEQKPAQEQKSDRLPPEVMSAYATVAKLNSDEYSIFAPAFDEAASAVENLSEYMISINGFNLMPFVPFTDEQIAEIKADAEEGEEIEIPEDYSAKVRDTLKLALSLSSENILLLYEQNKELRALRKREKEVGVKVGEEYSYGNKVIGKVIDVRKGRKIIIQKPDGGRVKVVPMKIQDMEEE